jgi:16S rRNA G1207 methylase RsmC
MIIQDKKYSINRYDLSEDKSLKPLSAADEYLLQTFNELEKKPTHTVIYNDRFGYLGCHLHTLSPMLILTQKSQEKAIISNFETNDIPSPSFSNPLSTLENKMDLALMKIPKSSGLFQLFLEQIIHNSTDDVTVICSFMTRHFSPKLLQIAQEYFEVVEQSKALKKARILVLSKKKKPIKKDLITSLTYNTEAYKQYLGVFSADHIDYATQFFLNHVEVTNENQQILDLGSGNGIIGKEISKKLPNAEIHLMDDSFLAVASAKLNIEGKNIHHYFDNDLSIFKEGSFDLIVTNPPFHFEYEINIQITLELFRGCHQYLKAGGNLQIVSSRHLNFKTHLTPLFSSVEIIAEDNKFVIYKCIK